MLYHLLVPWADQNLAFNVFRYVTFRAAGAVVTAFLVAFWFGPAIISRLRMLKVGQVVRTEGPQTHLGKSGTPTMGGVLIILSTVIPVFLWARLDNWYTVLALVTLIVLGAVGFLDDYLKIVRKNTGGLKGRYKIVGQAGMGLVLGALGYLTARTQPDPSSFPIGWDLSHQVAPLAAILLLFLTASLAHRPVRPADRHHERQLPGERVRRAGIARVVRAEGHLEQVEQPVVHLAALDEPARPQPLHRRRLQPHPHRSVRRRHQRRLRSPDHRPGRQRLQLDQGPEHARRIAGTAAARSSTTPRRETRRSAAPNRPRRAPVAATPAQAQRLRYSGTVGGAQVEVRGAPVNVTRDARTGELVIRSSDITVRVKPGRDQ